MVPKVLQTVMGHSDIAVTMRICKSGVKSQK